MRIWNHQGVQVTSDSEDTRSRRVGLATDDRSRSSFPLKMRQQRWRNAYIPLCHCWNVKSFSTLLSSMIVPPMARRRSVRNFRSISSLDVELELRLRVTTASLKQQVNSSGAWMLTALLTLPGRCPAEPWRARLGAANGTAQSRLRAFPYCFESGPRSPRFLL